MYTITKKEHQNFNEFLHIKKEPNELEKELFKKTYTYLRHVTWIPGIKMIAIGNSLSMLSTHKNSDIDLFVVSEKKRLWVVRFFLTLFFFFLGQRKSGKNHAGKFCLSFFVDETSLSFEKIAIKDDIYLFHRMLYLKPILDFDSTYEKFISKNSKWCNLGYFNEILAKNKSYIRITGRREKVNSSFGTLLDKLIQLFLLPKTKRAFNKLGKPFGIIINEHMLKFHDNDSRKKISEKLS